MLGDVVVADVAIIATDLLVATRAERIRALTGEHDDADREVVTGSGERIGQLEQRLRAEGVATLGAADGDLGDTFGHLVGDVLEFATRLPRREGLTTEVVDRVVGRASDNGLLNGVHAPNLPGDA